MGKVEILSIINIKFLNQKHCDYSRVIDTLIHTPSADLITMNVQTETLCNFLASICQSVFFPFEISCGHLQ